MLIRVLYIRSEDKSEDKRVDRENVADPVTLQLRERSRSSGKKPRASDIVGEKMAEKNIEPLSNYLSTCGIH